MGRRAISEFQVKQSAYPNAGRSWYIVGRPGGKRIRAWFDTQLVAEAEATRRNLSIQRFGQQAASFSGSLAYIGHGMPKSPAAVRQEPSRCHRPLSPTPGERQLLDTLKPGDRRGTPRV